MNMSWKYEKFIGDKSIYGICPKCNFKYNASIGYDSETEEANAVQEYNFCPQCGGYLRDSNIVESVDEIEVVWNEREGDK